mgnify:FL=1
MQNKRGCIFQPLCLLMGNYMVKNSDVQKLKDEISRLMAALEDVNFECQRLEIINSNLDFQLKSVNRELKQNIAMLEAYEEENKELKKQLESK